MVKLFGILEPRLGIQGSFLIVLFLRSTLAQACFIFATKKYKQAMFEIILSVGLYAAAIVLLVKGTIAFCDNTSSDIVTEP